MKRSNSDILNKVKNVVSEKVGVNQNIKSSIQKDIEKKK